MTSYTSIDTKSDILTVYYSAVLVNKSKMKTHTQGILG